MNNKKHVLACILVFYPVAVFAYIDPGSGTLLIQGLLALFGAIIVFVRSPRENIKRFYADIKNRITGSADSGKNKHKDNKDA